jgi:hypothetical protein
MREVVVSVRPESLATSEGTLVSISISVDASRLEALLDALAALRFPVNPEIHHDATSSAVEFPAYAGRVEEVRRAIGSYGFDPADIQVTGMLQRIRSAAG